MAKDITPLSIPLIGFGQEPGLISTLTSISPSVGIVVVGGGIVVVGGGTVVVVGATVVVVGATVVVVGATVVVVGTIVVVGGGGAHSVWHARHVFLIPA